MIADRDWNIFKAHVKPNTTIRCGCDEGYLLENFPYAQDDDRIYVERGYVQFFGHKTFTDDGRLISHFSDGLRIQLCTTQDEFIASPHELEFWIGGDFLDFEQVLALGEA